MNNRHTQNRNWFAVSRTIFEHHIVGAGQPVRPASPHRGSYSRMEAWLWIVANAAYEQSPAYNRGREVHLQIGQLVAATTRLATLWNWTPETVRWFLRQLEIAAMLTRENAKEQMRHNTNQARIITVSNYATYQSLKARAHQATPRARPTQNPKQTLASQPAPPMQNNEPVQQVPIPQPQQQNELVLYSPQAEPPGHNTKIQGTQTRKKKETSAFAEDIQAAFDAFNVLAEQCKLPRAEKLSPTRQTGIAKRLQLYGLEGWMRALANIEKSSFLRGMTEHNFRATIDFMCQAKSFDRLHDGGYGNGAHAPPKEGRTEKLFRIAAELSGIGPGSELKVIT